VATVTDEALRGKILTLGPTQSAERVDSDLAEVPILAKPPVGIAMLYQRIKVDQPLFAAVE